MGVKPWQLVVIALAVLGAIGSVLYTCSRMGENQVSQATEVNLVDIKTGNLFLASYPKTRPVWYPATLPDNKDAVLYPVFRGEGDKWRISARYLSAVVKDKALKPDLITDRGSGEIAAIGKPVRADVFGK